MPIGLLTLDIHLPESHSLKDKRQVLRSLKDRLRGKFNVAVSELEHSEILTRATIGVVKLADQPGFATRVRSRPRSPNPSAYSAAIWWTIRSNCIELGAFCFGLLTRDCLISILVSEDDRHARSRTSPRTHRRGNPS